MRILATADGAGYTILAASDADSGPGGRQPVDPLRRRIAAEAGVLISNLCQLTGGHSLNGDAACQAFPTPVTQAPAA